MLAPSALAKHRTVTWKYLRDLKTSVWNSLSRSLKLSKKTGAPYNRKFLDCKNQAPKYPLGETDATSNKQPRELFIETKFRQPCCRADQTKTIKLF